MRGCSAQLLLRPLLLGQLLSSLASCLSFDPAAAPLALHMQAADGGGAHHHSHHQHQHNQPPLPPQQQQHAAAEGGVANAAAGAGPGPGAAGEAGAAAAGSAAALQPPPACVLLPRMPLCAQHLGSLRSYDAVAAVARCLGHLARLADVCGVAGA